MVINNPIPDEPMERKSSIYQHKDLFCVMERGEWCPVVFDMIDRIECGKIYSHKVALRIAPGLGYTFPVGTCKHVKNTYFLTQKDETELRVLPDYYGTGFYQTHERKNMLTNIGKEAFGNRQEKILRVGKDYCISKKTLEAIE